VSVSSTPPTFTVVNGLCTRYVIVTGLPAVIIPMFGSQVFLTSVAVTCICPLLFANCCGL